MAETWTCPTCLTDHNEPSCANCGLSLTHEQFSVRVPGARTPAEVDRVRRIYGAQAASQVLLGDGLLAALRGRSDEQRLVDGLREADHYDMARSKW